MSRYRRRSHGLWAIRLRNLHHALEAITHHSPRTTRRTAHANEQLAIAPAPLSNTTENTHPLSHATPHAPTEHTPHKTARSHSHTLPAAVPPTLTHSAHDHLIPQLLHTRVHTKENKHTTPPLGIEMEREHIKSHSKEGMIQLGLAARRLLWRRGWGHSSCQPKHGFRGSVRAGRNAPSV